MPEMNFNFRDLYPNMGGGETSTDVQTDADDKEVLVENAREAQDADPKHARGFHMIIAAVVMIAVVVFLGAGD